MELYEISFPLVVCFGAVVAVYVYLREKIERAERDLKEYRAALEDVQEQVKDLQEQVKTIQAQFPSAIDSMNDYLETTRHVSTLLVQLREELDDMKKEL